ncbi:MAG: membrane protein insertase YidC [Burkholderiaceae bacterium]
MDIKRTVLLVIFSLSLLMLWENWTIYNGGASMFAPEVASTSNNATSNTKSDSSVPQASISTPVASGADVPAGAVSAQAGEKITITTDLLKAEINSAGGELTRIELLQHKDSANESKNVVLMESDSGRTYVGQSGLIGTSAPNHRSLFTVRPGMRTLENADSVQLILDAEQDGVKLTKTYTFKRGEYEIELSHEVTNGSAAAITPSVYVQLVRDDSKLEGDSSFYSTFTGPAIYTDAEKFRKVTFEDIDKGKQPPAAQTDKGWIAIVQHYFVSAFEPLDKGTVELFTRKIDNKLYAVGAIMKMESIAPGAKAISKGKLYTGPQESANLEKFAPDFDLVKDYGWLTLIAKPIFWLMEQIQKLLGNWGWTIIVLTIMIKLAFFPLSAASYRSMAKMKLVTPKMTAIRERHKGDAQQMNAAMMELYKTEKINPLGGCLPVVVQIPVFIALYWVLLASVEMRHAPWLGWIQDLAAPDPWYILPVIMAASMFVQTKLNPTPPDPIQAKVMMFMPIAFSVMFFFFPSGLVLYWVVNNLLSIAQQWVITQKAEKGK